MSLDWPKVCRRVITWMQFKKMQIWNPLMTMMVIQTQFIISGRTQRELRTYPLVKLDRVLSVFFHNYQAPREKMTSAIWYFSKEKMPSSKWRKKIRDS
jgi:hypothetical protein